MSFTSRSSGVNRKAREPLPPSKIPRHAGGAFNPRKPTAWLAAAAMGVVVYMYGVSSIQAAKRNAKLHREADGGQVDMRRESLRRHGMLPGVEGTRAQDLYTGPSVEEREGEIEEVGGGSKALPMGSVGGEKEEAERRRTRVEEGLGEYKGVGTAVKKFREEKGS